MPRRRRRSGDSFTFSFSLFLFLFGKRQHHLDDRRPSWHGAADQGAPYPGTQVLSRDSEAVEGRRRRKRGRRRRIAGGRARALPSAIDLLLFLFFVSFFLFLFVSAAVNEELGPLGEDHALKGHHLPRGRRSRSSSGLEGEAPRRRRGRGRGRRRAPFSSSLSTPTPNAQRQRVEAPRALRDARRGLWRCEGDVRGGQARRGDERKRGGGGGWEVGFSEDGGRNGELSELSKVRMGESASRASFSKLLLRQKTVDCDTIRPVRPVRSITYLGQRRKGTPEPRRRGRMSTSTTMSTFACTSTPPVVAAATATAAALGSS